MRLLGRYESMECTPPGGNEGEGDRLGQPGDVSPARVELRGRVELWAVRGEEAEVGRRYPKFDTFVQILMKTEEFELG